MNVILPKSSQNPEKLPKHKLQPGSMKDCCPFEVGLCGYLVLHVSRGLNTNQP